MQKVKIFMSSATGEGLEELEQIINKWIEKEKIEIKNISTSVRLIPSGERASLTSEITDQFIVCLTYESK
ncbi:MAG: hypothetical protein KJ887_05565 [Candidatus Omnitrophica bacterium]|nr:hypothetical protein [Candidatus Omnitrophota bacterium]MBU1048040.1 hypothetical protein [Candidatus Omnitrophota bacterium]MBU1630367.1 hypothetical protein [Candidatus Omnitrophota bacterium]MBU1767080.1 hypothetical protein [Candidatus Omnitrophota bacterium]MBU1889410.1 hypothetical protein [Candidatus Omnitrophota bacterium]